MNREQGSSQAEVNSFSGIPDTGKESFSKDRRRPWRVKFHDAFRGLKLGVRGHSSFFVHFFFAALVLASGIVLQCVFVEWCILLGCIGLVLTAELFNSSIETLFRGLDDLAQTRVAGALDIAASAVLCASITAAVVGGLVIGYRLLVFLGWLGES